MLCAWGVVTGWLAYTPRGGDAAGNGLARGCFEIGRFILFGLALLSGACFGLALGWPEGGLLFRVLGGIFLLVALGLLGAHWMSHRAPGAL
ncbi:hypothetical protein [Melittangium boletus]|uniref:hypothetical protein n=1 Tax=Melittangium boletus TaxID=83453 RepID=UPI003DA6ADA9